MADLVFYDGDCGLCSLLVQFILPRDSRDRFRFAALQSAFAGELLGRYGLDASKLDTIYVAADYQAADERILSKARAVLRILRTLGGIWVLARPLELLPSAVLDPAYDILARNRYRWFGRADTCSLPEAEERQKFID